MFQITKEVETSQQPYSLHKAINMSIIDPFLSEEQKQTNKQNMINK
jgi:hypothetical protein